MRAYLLSDGELLTPRYRSLDKLVSGYLLDNGFEIDPKTIERNELAFCRGCIDCWVKTPGECIMKDHIQDINRACMTSDVVVYFCPVVFGQFSANIKSAVDRWLPNMLPFFSTRKDGSTMHPPRYVDYPKQIIIAYADAMSDEEASLFYDITMKHRNNIAMIVDRGDDADIISAFKGVTLQRIGGTL
jgi:multimeric flavodoxin WrbA